LLGGGPVLKKWDPLVVGFIAGVRTMETANSWFLMDSSEALPHKRDRIVADGGEHSTWSDQDFIV
jgi:hypothetical protein